MVRTQHLGLEIKKPTELARGGKGDGGEAGKKKKEEDRLALLGNIHRGGRVKKKIHSEGEKVLKIRR